MTPHLLYFENALDQPVMKFYVLLPGKSVSSFCNMAGKLAIIVQEQIGYSCLLDCVIREIRKTKR